VKHQDIPKLYYSISEVSKLAEVDQHVLRYWETEFKELAPRKNRSGKRLYREQDLDIVRLIKRLLYGERYTIEGARRRLKEDLEGGAQHPVQEESSSGENRLLSDIKVGLMEVKQLLEGQSE
jgi:DNA-binding transcriptional MerR regulator